MWKASPRAREREAERARERETGPKKLPDSLARSLAIAPSPRVASPRPVPGLHKTRLLLHYYPDREAGNRRLEGRTASFLSDVEGGVKKKIRCIGVLLPVLCLASESNFMSTKDRAKPLFSSCPEFTLETSWRVYPQSHTGREWSK